LASALVLSEGRGQGLGGAHETVDGHQSRQLLLAPAIGARGPTRQHHPAHVAGAVMDAHLDTLGQPQVKPMRQRPAWVLVEWLLVAVVAIPPRRSPEQVGRVAGAERATHDVVQRRRILGYAELAEPAGRNVQFTHRLAAPRKEGLLEDGIDPGAG